VKYETWHWHPANDPPLEADATWTPATAKRRRDPTPKRKRE